MSQRLFLRLAGRINGRLVARVLATAASVMFIQPVWATSNARDWQASEQRQEPSHQAMSMAFGSHAPVKR
jgi:hypothetical protein